MFKIYDKNHNFLKMLGDGCRNIYTTETISTGFRTLCFDVPCQEEYINLIDEENYVETADYNYIIKEILADKNDFITVKCGPDIEEIQGTIFMIFDCFDKNLAQAYEYCLSATGWTVDYQSKDKSVVVYQEANTNAYDMINKIAEEYRQERWFDTKNKVLHIYDRMGSTDPTAYYSNELKLIKLNKQSSTYNYATVLYPIGKDGLTISSVNNNKPYLENFNYSNKYIEKIWINEDYDIPEELMRAGQQFLDSIAEPKASYKIKLNDLGGDAGLGDNILIIDNIKKIKQKQRIVKIVRYPKAPENDSIELSNQQVDFATDFIKGQRKIQQDIDYIKNILKNLK